MVAFFPTRRPEVVAAAEEVRLKRREKESRLLAQEEQLQSVLQSLKDELAEVLRRSSKNSTRQVKRILIQKNSPTFFDGVEC